MRKTNNNSNNTDSNSILERLHQKNAWGRPDQLNATTASDKASWDKGENGKHCCSYFPLSWRQKQLWANCLHPCSSPNLKQNNIGQSLQVGPCCPTTLWLCSPGKRHKKGVNWALHFCFSSIQSHIPQKLCEGYRIIT